MNGKGRVEENLSIQGTVACLHVELNHSFASQIKRRRLLMPVPVTI